MGRLRARVRPGTEQRLPAPARAQLSLAYGPPGRRGHLVARQLLVGIRRNGRCGVVGALARCRGGGVGPRGAFGDGLARRPGLAGHGRVVRRRVGPAPPPGPRRITAVRGPPLQSDGRRGRHRDQSDDGSFRRRRAPRALPGGGLDAAVGRRRPARPLHLHADAVATRDVNCARHPSGPCGRHEHGGASLGLDCHALPDPVLLRPGGAQPPAVVRASAFVRPLSWPGRKVRGHIGRRDRDQQSTRRPGPPRRARQRCTSAMCPSATGQVRASSTT